MTPAFLVLQRECRCRLHLFSFGSSSDGRAERVGGCTSCAYHARTFNRGVKNRSGEREEGQEDSMEFRVRSETFDDESGALCLIVKP